MFDRHSQISSLLFKLPFTMDSLMENKEKVAVSDYDGVTRRKMILIMSLLNFEPNDEARDLLQKTYMEDIITLLSLNERNLLHFAEHFDNTGTCINKELNGITNALIVSGGKNANSLSSVEVFFPSLNSQSSKSTISLPPFPNGIFHHSQNGLLQCGGVGSLDSCHELTRGVWTKIHSLDQERRGHTSWRTNSGSLFLLGGFNHSMATTTKINDRRSIPEAGFVLRNKTRFACSIPDTTSMLITGGWSNGAATDQVSRYDEGGWKEDLPPLKTARYYHGCAQYFTNMGTAVFIVMGGSNGGVALDSAEQYTERERRWRESTALPHALTGVRAATLDNLIYLTGGKDEEREYRDEIYQLDTRNKIWKEVGKMKTARGIHAISVINYRLVEGFAEF